MRRILDRYIFRELLPPFLIGLALFTFVLLMNIVLDLARITIKGGVGFAEVGQVLIWSLPHILALTVPMSVLLAANLGLGRMSADNEITILHASGVGLTRIGRPLFFFAALTTALTALILIRLVPQANQHARAHTYEMAKRQWHQGIQPREFFERYAGRVIYTADIDEETNLWTEVMVADMQQRDEPKLTFARTGRMNYNEAEKYVVLDLKDGETFSIDLMDPATSSRSTFTNQQLVFNLENLMPSGPTTPGDREMTLGQLAEETQRRRMAGMKWRHLAVELHKKFAIPAACLVFGIIGLAIGARNRSRGKSAGFVVSLSIILVYYIFLTTGERMGDQGRLQPWLAMWGANILIGSMGLTMMVLAAPRAGARVLEGPSPPSSPPSSASSPGCPDVHGPSSALGPAARRSSSGSRGSTRISPESWTATW